MSALDNYRNPQFVQPCEAALETFANNHRGIDTILLATTDGFEISCYPQTKRKTVDKLAAVGSSLFALGASLSKELDLQQSNSVLLDSEQGKVYLSTITQSKHAMILMIQTNNQATLGALIHGVKSLSKEIGNHMQQFIH